EAVGKLLHVQGAHENAARVLHPAYDLGVGGGRGTAGEYLRAGDRRYALDVEKVLRGEWHAGKRAGVLAARDHGIDPLRSLACPFVRYRGKGIYRAVTLVDARERHVHDILRRQPARADV